MICKIEFWFSLTSFLVFLAFPMILLAVAFTTMLVEVQRIVRTTPGLDGLSTVSIKERRAIYMFSLMYLTFLLLAMPYYTVRLWIDIYHYKYGVEPACSATLLRLIVALKYCTSFIRPMLYAFTSSDLRAVGKKLMEKMLKCYDVSYRISTASNVTSLLEENNMQRGAPQNNCTTRFHMDGGVWRTPCESLEDMVDLKDGRCETDLTDY